MLAEESFVYVPGRVTIVTMIIRIVTLLVTTVTAVCTWQVFRGSFMLIRYIRVRGNLAKTADKMSQPLISLINKV